MVYGPGSSSFVLLTALGLLLAPGGPPAAAQPARTPAVVLAVVDGDTIEVAIDGARERVRYIGIDAPEMNYPDRAPECRGPEATARNSDFVAGQTVGLERDLTERDQYGRLLRYVWVGETLVNAELVFEGEARAISYPPDVRYQGLTRELERQAREARRGLWAACG